ncbi:MAG TPA: GNAT family N-acetyltransferase [Chitinophagaceae bacterium]|nr:GNAT family N-acetyltransferase [Chitinophagaceae bacterium]
MKNNPETIIRRATEADLPVLLQFEQELIRHERAFDCTIRSGAVHYYDLRAMIESDSVCLLVAEQEGRVVASGYARVEKARPWLDHEEYAYLGFMYVDPALRGLGLNTQIIEALKTWCRQKALRELRLEVYSGNSAAIRAYEKAGFGAHIVEMRTEVSGLSRGGSG